MSDRESKTVIETGEIPLTPARQFVLMLSRVWAWAFLGLLIVFFIVSVPITSGGAVNFLTLRNSQNILVAITPILLLGLGQTFVIIGKGIDLSVGWVMSLGSVLAALAIRATFNAGLPLFPSVVVGFIAAVGGAGFVGLVSGVIIAKLKVPAFIVTLGVSFIVRGVALLLSENTTVIGLPRGIRNYGNDALLYIIGGEGGGIYFFSRPDVTGELLRRMDRILPFPVIITAIVVAIAIFVMRKTQFGRHTYGSGPTHGCSGRPSHHFIVCTVGLHGGYCRIFIDTALYGRLGSRRRPPVAVVDRRGHHRWRELVRRRGNRGRYGHWRPDRRHADDRPRDAECAVVVAIHRSRRRRDCCGTDRPIS